MAMAIHIPTRTKVIPAVLPLHLHNLPPLKQSPVPRRAAAQAMSMKFNLWFS